MSLTDIEVHEIGIAAIHAYAGALMNKPTPATWQEVAANSCNIYLQATKLLKDHG